MRFFKKQFLNFTRRLVFFVPILTKAFAYTVSGTVYNEKNEPLPFVNISIDQTGTGTSSNLDGIYSLQLSSGEHQLTFRFIGYATKVENVVVDNDDIHLDVYLKPQDVLIKPFYVTANGEDPAYPIIRKAQKKRKFYLKQVKRFQFNSYIKGSALLRNAPEKIMGREILLDGLDSTRSGIIYLSESVSNVFIDGNKQKEIMVSSKVSGRSQGFSWNSALQFQLNFYDNLVPTPVTDRDVVSPIATDAMTYYRYKLLGEYYDNGVTVYKIQVTPKLTGSPLVNGIIEIQDSTWRIHAIDIFVTKDNGMSVLDTLNMKVIFKPVTKDIWMKGNQHFDFRFTFNLFKLKGDGHFLGNFTDYVIDPKFEKNFFNGEVVRVDEESNQKTEAYWDSIRPVQLSLEEKSDYQMKDSLEKLRETKPYLDSLDKRRNRIKATDILGGYTWHNSWRNIDLYISSPLMGFHFNTVEGIVLHETIGFEKYYKKQKARTMVYGTIRYGFSSRRLYAQGSFVHRFNSTNRWYVRLRGGKMVSQFNPGVMPELHNSLYSIFLEINHWRLYEKNYISLISGGEVTNGVHLTLGFEADHRFEMFNANPLTPFFINNENRNFGDNNSFNNPNATMPGMPYWALTGEVKLRFTPGQKYMMRPGRKFNYRSKWPHIGLNTRFGFIKPDSAQSFAPYVMGEVYLDQNIDMGIIGNSEYYVSAGYFFVPPEYFPDFKHFNTTQTAFAPQNTLRSFWIAPYYQFSTNEWFTQAHYQHHFKGLLLGKIPGVKKLKIYEVVGFHFLYTPHGKDYYEFTVGFENIFRIFRVDFVGGFIRGENPYWGGRIKVAI